MKKTICFALSMVCLLFAIGCMPNSAIADVEIERLPNKLEYIAGVDTKLDVDGLVFTTTGERGEEYTYSCTSDSVVQQAHSWSESCCANDPVYQLRIDEEKVQIQGLTLTGDVDFSVPGTYTMKIVWDFNPGKQPAREFNAEFEITVVEG